MINISSRHSDFAISRGFYFHETLHMQSLSKISPRENFRIYNIFLISNTWILLTDAGFLDKAELNTVVLSMDEFLDCT